MTFLPVETACKLPLFRVWKAKKQAELDKLAVANSFSLVPRLAGIFGVIVAHIRSVSKFPHYN